MNSDLRTNFKRIKKLKKMSTIENDTNAIYKRPFLLEKIAKDIHCENLISSLYYKYEDPLIRQNFLKLKKKTPKKDINKLTNDEMYSIKKISFHKLNKKSCNLPLIFTRQRNPEKFIENENKTSNILNNSKENEKDDEKLVTCGMFKDDSFKQKNNIKVRSFINNQPGEQSLKYYKKIDDINKVNEKYNLNLKLKQITPYNGNRRMTIFGMLNKLYQKYSGGDCKIYKNININTDRMRSISTGELGNGMKIIEHDKNSNENTIDYSKEFPEDDNNTFITKVKIDKKILPKDYIINNIMQRHKDSLNNFSKNNDSTIDQDNKVYINCLISKANMKISTKKILYKYIDRTIYELENDPDYQRIKSSEPDLWKLLKREK